MRRPPRPYPALLGFLILLTLFLHHRPAQADPEETLVVAGGCFWCVESDFESVPGVLAAVSGFAGGQLENPSYKQVSRGDTGHYEAVAIRFDPGRVSRSHLLDLFFRSVDPTDPGGQFCDRGTAYRTAVFVSDAGEKTLAESAIARAQADLGQTVVTPVLPLGRFYPADSSHQDYHKGSTWVLTRFGPKRQHEAYRRYRLACGRDARVQALWGAQAPFSGKYLKP